MPSAPDQAPRDCDVFVLWLVERHAALAALLREHLGNHDGLLCHVFFGDVTRHYRQLCDLGDVSAAKALVADIDAGLANGDDEIENVIHVSFLENLDHERGSVSWALLTPRLKSGFEVVHAQAGQA